VTPVVLASLALLVPPSPALPIPRTPARLVLALDSTTRAVNESIREWGGRGTPPQAVTLYVLYQQRIERVLAANARLAAVVLPHVGYGIRSDVLALRELRRLATPQPLARFRTRRSAPPEQLRAYYLLAQRRFGVPWNVLAAVNYVESAFGKLGNASVAGAQGPMQFLPATWRAYGLGGDVHRPRDAILGAANYLRANGAPRRLAHALLRYNPSPLYVDAVLRYARRIARDPHAFLTYYSRQVFVLTPAGQRRITGPGAASR
jgi:soluble lytic murein transglycosylase-like protein